MAELLAPPDPVALTIGHLQDVLASISGQGEVPIYKDIPHDRPTEFITVQFTGGPGRTGSVPVDGAGIIVEAWAGTTEAANTLASNARAVVLSMRGQVIGGAVVYEVQDGGYPVDLPHDLSDQPRFTFTAQLSLRAQRLTTT